MTFKQEGAWLYRRFRKYSHPSMSPLLLCQSLTLNNSPPLIIRFKEYISEAVSLCIRGRHWKPMTLDVQSQNAIGKSLNQI